MPLSKPQDINLIDKHTVQTTEFKGYQDPAMLVWKGKETSIVHIIPNIWRLQDQTYF